VRLVASLSFSPTKNAWEARSVEMSLIQIRDIEVVK